MVDKKWTVINTTNGVGFVESVETRFASQTKQLLNEKN